MTIDNICRQHGVRLLLLRSYGLLGYVRPSVPEQCVVESKPDSKVDDLRCVRYCWYGTAACRGGACVLM